MEGDTMRIHSGYFFKFPIIFLAVILTVYFLNCHSQSEKQLTEFPKLTGPYLGQTPPGDEAVPFAPGIITSGMYTRDLTMTPDGKEIYFCVSAYGFNLIFFTKEVNGFWTEPQPASFVQDFQYMYYEPHITPNGQRLLFLSNQPSVEREEKNEDIWVVDRIESDWGEPYNLGQPINTEHQEYYPSTTREGTIYFTRQKQGEPVGYIYRSYYVDGRYSEPEKLGPEVNCGRNHFNAYIHPDEEFIIVPVIGREDSYGSTDYYIVFRNKDDLWSDPINLGAKINTDNGREYSCSLSPDDRHFFFMTTRTRTVVESSRLREPFVRLIELFSEPQNGNADIYWVDAGFIEKLRPEGF
jgi:hypothetical protein